MMPLFRCGVAIACLFALAPAAVLAREPAQSIFIPAHVDGPQRNITTDDLARLRDIDSLSVSPDGRRFAILVRQAVPEENIYRTGWFVGAMDGGPLTYVGDGGEERLMVAPNGHSTGDLGGSVGRWSPDGRSIAYMVRRDGEVQLWRSRADGRAHLQLTHNASDVRDFAWSEDGESLYFKVGTDRATLAARAEQRARTGYRLQDFDTVFRALGPKPPALALETDLTTWRVSADGHNERVASELERAELEAAEARQFSYRRGGFENDASRLSTALAPPVPRGDGASVWLERSDPSQDGMLPFARLTMRSGEGEEPVACRDPLCEGQVFLKIWWSQDGEEVLFWRVSGETDANHSFYAWRPATGAVRTVFSASDHFVRDCELAGAVIVCLRETPLEPRHVAAFDVQTGAVAKIADVNPEMALFRLGRVEPIEWETDPRAESFGYAPHARGFILYPPDYDPSRSYPLYIAPYTAGGFMRGDVGNEHPLLVYAANGFIVLNTGFPPNLRVFARGSHAAMMNRIYDPALGYPHLSIYAGSTFRALDLAMTRAHVDPRRIAIGGVSHGAFVPLLMLQNSDRFAAVSVASGSWSQIEYYFRRLPDPYGEHPPTSFPEDADFWAPLDLAQHLDTIEAPVLFQMADAEVVITGVLIRRMADARIPVEAFSFPNELHLKWQSAHRLAVYNRNLDWFRFWLQDIEDPDPAKAEQYERWRRLRELQCRNERSMRDYCDVQSIIAPPVH